MIRSRYEIELREGVKVEMLFTLALFGIAKKRGISLDLGEDADEDDRITYFIKVMYVAAILAWEYRAVDSPDMGDFPYKMMDFAEWSGNHPLQFAKIIKGASSAIAGVETDEGNGDQDGDGVKKK